VRAETECRHCSRPLALEIDSAMAIHVDPEDADPLIFIPDVAVFDVKGPSIVDDF